MIAARIAFSDRRQAHARARHLEDHKSYLRNAPIRILQSGPFAGERPGALIVADVGSLDDLESFNAGDPFVINGVYAEVHLVEWTITLADHINQ